MADASTEHVDVLIVGAGLSGIGAACHLTKDCPARRSRSSRRATRSAAPGTCSATRASARTRTCSRSATRSGRGRRPRRSPTGPSILRYVRETAREYGVDEQDPLRPPGRARRVVDATTRAGPSTAERTDTGETVQLTCGFLFALHRLLPLRRGLHARASRASSASAGQIVHPQHWPEDLDYDGQARRRDRQRRDRGDARARDGRAGRARDDAAALAELRRLAARRGPASPTSLRRVLPDARPPTRSCAGRTSLLDACSASSSAAARPRLMRGADPQGRRAAAARRATTSTPTSSPQLRPVGPAPVPRPRRRPVRGDLRAATRRSSPTGSRRSPRRGSGSRPARSSRPTSSSPPPASTCSPLGGIELAVDGARGRPRRDGRLQGHDAQRRARTSRSRSATRTRPGRSRATSSASTSAGCSTTWTSTATPACTPRAPDPSRRARAVHRPQVGLRPARDRPVPEAGRRPPWRLHQNYPRDVLMLRRGELEDEGVEFSRAPVGRTADKLAA